MEDDLYRDDDFELSISECLNIPMLLDLRRCLEMAAGAAGSPDVKAAFQRMVRRVERRMHAAYSELSPTEREKFEAWAIERVETGNTDWAIRSKLP